MTLSDVLSAIVPVEEQHKAAAVRHWDTVAHPLHSLGMLEDLIVTIAGAQHTEKVHLHKKAVIAMCADNGVVEEGVTQSGQEITALVAENMGSGTSSVCTMAKVADAKVFPVNVGIAADIVSENVINRCIRRGTRNFTKEPAMTREECIKAILVGVEMVERLSKEGYDLIATGEMGIGNTTTSAALISVLLGEEPERVTGRGAGLTSEGLSRKVDAIYRGIQINQPNHDDPIDVLHKVGGLDIAGLVGVFLGGARYHVPIIIDGLISSVAALIAVRLCPHVKGYLIPSHQSAEPAGKMVLEELELSAIINGRLCLGEGTGAVCLMPLLHMALTMYRDMSSFEGYHMDAYEHLT